MHSNPFHSSFSTDTETRGSAGPRSPNPLVAMIALTAMLAASTCREPAWEEPGYVTDTESYFNQRRQPESIVTPEPAFEVNVPEGGRLLFFLDEHDDGVAVLGQLDSYSRRGSALDHPDLQDATPAVTYHAVTQEGTAIPDVLLTHHDALAREFDLAPFEVAIEGRERGWFLAEPPSATSSSPCLNATFTANICAHPDYDEAVCKKNTSGTWIWKVPGAYRYKAGFCLQAGQAHSWLTYTHVAWDSQQGYCTSCLVIHAGWGSVLFPEKWSATTYLVYSFWKGTGTSWARSFEHVGGYSTGDLFDWGQRYSWQPCQFYD